MLYGLQVTLGDTSIHKLSALIAAATGYGSVRPNFCTILLQADPGNSGNIFVGDSNLGSSNYGKQLAASATFELRSDRTDVFSTLDIYVLASATGQKLNIILIGA
jgi:hypothetical protein